MSEFAEPWTTIEVESLPLSYSCELLFANSSIDEANTGSLPSDSYLVYYQDKEGTKIDICRAPKMVNIFDLYYDRFGSSIKKIDYSMGRVNPRVWKQSKKKVEEVKKK
jgi:hypothetical protein